MKTAIETGDVVALRRLLAEAPARANELIRWGKDGHIATHPLHYIADMLFDGTLERGKELPLLDALLEAGADVNFQQTSYPSQKPGHGETPLIGAASLGAEDVGLRLLDAGARPELRGNFGETALHWAALLGEDRLVERLIPGSDVNLKDDNYKSSSLGWAIHGWSNPPAGNQGRQLRVVQLLVSAGAKVEPEWLQSAKVRADTAMLAALQAGDKQ